MEWMRKLIAVAHADDETLGCFTVLDSDPENVWILHATDSAPRNPKYAWRSGYATRSSYAAARSREMAQALRLAGIDVSRYHCLGIADQEAPRHWREIRQWVLAFGPAEIYTHAYEGGHPDHDAVARALSGIAGVIEFPLYHADGADFVPHSFLGEDQGAVSQLTVKQCEKKRKMLQCFASQQRVIGNFPVEREVFRPVREYDFSQPPHGGELYYEKRKLGWTFPEWREAVAD